MSPQPIKTFKNVNTPIPLKKGKGKIVKIDFGEHEQEIKRIWEGKPPAKLIEKWKEAGLTDKHPERYYNAGTMLARMNKIKNLVGTNLAGRCSKCNDLGTYLIKYKTQGVTVIERYCEACLPK